MKANKGVSPEPVESVVGAVDGEDGGAGVGLGHAPVPLQHDDLGPDLVVDRVPLAQDLVDVVLKDRQRCEKVTTEGKLDQA